MKIILLTSGFLTLSFCLFAQSFEKAMGLSAGMNTTTLSMDFGSYTGSGYDFALVMTNSANKLEVFTDLHAGTIKALGVDGYAVDEMGKRIIPIKYDLSVFGFGSRVVVQYNFIEYAGIQGGLDYTFYFGDLVGNPGYVGKPKAANPNGLTSEEIEDIRENGNIFDETKHLTFAVPIGIVAMYRGFQVYARYQIGLTNLMRVRSSGSSIDDSVPITPSRINILSFGVSYRFFKNRAKYRF